MNKISDDYLPRWAGTKLRSIIREARVTVLTGARQVGKSTLLTHELDSAWVFHSLDDLDVQGQASRDPEVLLQAGRQVVLDEAHLIPTLFPLVKQIVDRDRSRRFILSGSANLLLLSRTTESLAGRAEFMHLLPLSWGELGGHPAPSWLEHALAGELVLGNIVSPARSSSELAASVWRGGMPEAIYRDSEASLTRWRDGYIRSYLERDLRQLSQIDNLPDFKRLMSLAAWRCGCLFNQSELARDAGLSQPTAHRYLGLLEVSEQCCRLPAFHGNASKTIVKSPKLMWTDTGMAAFCAGFHSAGDLLASRAWGQMLENCVFQQLRAISDTWDVPGELFFWRTRSGVEVDFVIRRGRQLLAIEVKASTKVRFDDTVGLQQFMSEYPECRSGIVLYAGDNALRLSERLTAIPLAWLGC